MKKIVTLIIGIIALTSCSEKYNPLGKWGEYIKLSTNRVDFAAGADSLTVTTGGDMWWVDGISFQDSTYRYYGSEDVIMKSLTYTITEEQFVVQRQAADTLFVKLKANDTGEDRDMIISIQAGNYYDTLRILQPVDSD